MNRRIAFTTVAALVAVSGTASAQTGRTRGIDQIMQQIQNPGLLELSATVGQQQIEITVGPLPGQVQVSGIGGLPNGGNYTGITDIRLVTGNAQDFVEFRINSAVVPNIWVNTGAGNSDVKFTYDIPTTTESVNTSVQVAGLGGNDVVTFNVESRAASFNTNWLTNQGNGNNETIVSINSPELSDFLGINLVQSSGSGQDKLEVLSTSAAASVSTNILGNLGGNADLANLFITSLVPTTGSSLYNYTMGNGNDAFNTEIIAPGSTWAVIGSVFGGGGFDTVTYKQEADGVVDLLLDGGTGNDLTDMFFKGAVSGAPTQLGGDGNDELKMFVDGPILCQPLLDGGAGIDKASGFGTFVNVEEIN